MVKEAEQLISEIKQIKDQYQIEVGSKRRPWPKSIRERIEVLERLGVRAKTIAGDTGVPYPTILQWQFLRRKKLKTNEFHQLIVAKPKPAAPAPTVTVKAEPKFITTVTVITPLGFKVEGSAEAICKILKSNRGNL
jgi:hypothetical protein